MNIPAPTSVGISAVSDVGAVAEAFAAFFKAADTLLTILNSPAMLAARQRADVQAILNKDDADLVQAQHTGDATQVSKDSSG